MNDERLLRFLEGNLPGEEAGRLRERLERDDALRERLDALREMRTLLQSSAPASFDDGFSERVTRRIASEHTQAEEAHPAALAQTFDTFLADVLYGPLQGLFPRLAFTCLLVIAGLGAANASAYQGVTSSFLSAVFGLPSASITEALYYAAL